MALVALVTGSPAGGDRSAAIHSGEGTRACTFLLPQNYIQLPAGSIPGNTWLKPSQFRPPNDRRPVISCSPISLSMVPRKGWNIIAFLFSPCPLIKPPFKPLFVCFTTFPASQERLHISRGGGKKSRQNSQTEWREKSNSRLFGP